MKNYILITNLANILPIKYVFSSKLFIAYYKKIVKKITYYIVAKRYFNLIIDKTSNICKEQRQNLSIIIKD